MLWGKCHHFRVRHVRVGRGERAAAGERAGCGLSAPHCDIAASGSQQEQGPEQGEPEPASVQRVPLGGLHGSRLQEDPLGCPVCRKHRGVLKAEPCDNRGLSVPIAAAGVMQGQLSCVGGPHAEACALNSASIFSQQSVPSKGGQESFLLTLDTAGALHFFQPQ